MSALAGHTGISVPPSCMGIYCCSCRTCSAVGWLPPTANLEALLLLLTPQPRPAPLLQLLILLLQHSKALLLPLLLTPQPGLQHCCNCCCFHTEQLRSTHWAL
jgi:hypothetical protein